MKMMKKILTALVLILSAPACSPTTQLSNTQFKDLPESHLIFDSAMFNDNIGSNILTLNWSYQELMTLDGMGAPSNFYSYIVDVSKGKIIPLTISGEDIDTYSSTISPNGEYIAFNKMSDDIPIMKLSYFMSGEKSTNPQININYPDRALLAWSPDSNQLAILGIRDNIASLDIYDLAKNSLNTVFEYSQTSLDILNTRDRVSWSSDGKKIAFSLEFEVENSEDKHFLQSDMFVYDIARNNLARITNTPDLTEHFPSWYPGGEVITYITSDSYVDKGWSQGKLSFSTEDGTCSKILPGFIGIAGPSWSPDGTQLAYVSVDGVEILDIKNLIPGEYLSSEKLCQSLN